MIPLTGSRCIKHMLRMLQRGLHTTAPQGTRVPAACRTRPASAAWLFTRRQWTHQALIASKPWGCTRLASTGSDRPVVADPSAGRPQETPASVAGNSSLEVEVDVCVEGELDQHSRCCMCVVYRHTCTMTYVCALRSWCEQHSAGSALVRRQSIEQLHAAVERDAALVMQAAVLLVAPSTGDQCTTIACAGRLTAAYCQACSKAAMYRQHRRSCCMQCRAARAVCGPVR